MIGRRPIVGDDWRAISAPPPTITSADPAASRARPSASGRGTWAPGPSGRSEVGHPTTDDSGSDVAFDRLLAGEIDWMLDPPRPEDIASLQVQHPDRIVLSPNPFTIYVGFDLRRPPFDDVRVRQAVNHAIDRDHLVELLGGPTRHRPTCQILPPNFQGYEPFCPYTLEPGSGTWSGPDVPRARALIEAAGAVGEEVAVWVMREDPFLGGTPPTMRYVTDVLDDIGLRAELTIKEIDPYFGVIYGQPHDNPPHVFLSGWATDYLGAANFIETQFRCGAGSNVSGYCSDRLDARIGGRSSSR